MVIGVAELAEVRQLLISGSVWSQAEKRSEGSRMTPVSGIEAGM